MEKEGTRRGGKAGGEETSGVTFFVVIINWVILNCSSPIKRKVSFLKHYFRTFSLCSRTALICLCLFSFSSLQGIAQTNTPTINSKPVTPDQRARNNYVTAQAKFEISPEDSELAWHFARAAFDWADFAPDNKQREHIALQGIAAARRGIVSKTNNAPAHYYLAMNMGQLARTRSIGALKLVDEMEREFKKVRELDQMFDYAGPDRNLGLLYLEAPSSFSIGDKEKARTHLTQAVKLSPNYPDNRLNLLEAYLKWNDAKSAQAEFNEMEKIWSAARKQFSGELWRSSWVEWEKRRSKALEKLRSFVPRR